MARMSTMSSRCSLLDIVDIRAIVDTRAVVDISDVVDCVSHLVRAGGAVWRCFERLACGSSGQKFEKHLV